MFEGFSPPLLTCIGDSSPQETLVLLGVLEGVGESRGS